MQDYTQIRKLPANDNEIWIPWPVEPLLQRLAPLPHESLTSLLIRLALHNHHEIPTDIILWCNQTLKRAGVQGISICRPTTTVAYRILIALTGLDVHLIHSTTLHHFAAVLNPGVSSPWNLSHMHRYSIYPPIAMFPLLNTSGLGLTQTRTPFTCAYCPACLRESFYQRLIWNAKLALVCLEHRCGLLMACPYCHWQITTRTLLTQYCQRCHGNLITADAPSISLDDEGWRTHELMQGWLLQHTPIPMAGYEAAFQYPPAALVHIVTVMRALREREAPAQTLNQACHNLQWAVEGLADWPAALHEKLRWPGPIAWRFWRDVSHVYLHSYKQPVLDFVREALEIPEETPYGYWAR